MRLLFERGALFYACFNLRLFFFLLFRKADLLVSNDLDTLLPNYLISRWKKVRLVYDTHEYFTEVPELISRPRVKAIWEKIERSTFPKLTTVYTVNHSIARLYEEKHGVPVKVVRNVSPLWEPLNVPGKKALGIPEGKFLLIMQGAGLNIDRGVEEAVAMMHFMEDTLLLIVGDGDSIPEMKEKVQREKLTKKVLFFAKRPYAELMLFTYHADLGLSFDQPTNLNYRFSLPNKVFDYMHAGTPVACSNVIEVATLVRRHAIGIVIEDFRAQNLARTLSDLLRNTPEMERLKANCRIAAQAENWQQETAVLAEIYPRVG
jgi:glycosyltransferase involved in cell wall biosynthesis